MAVMAHELGHAQQHENKSILISRRNVLVPAIRFSPTITYLLILIGLIFNASGAFWLGVLFAVAIVLAPRFRQAFRPWLLGGFVTV